MTENSVFKDLNLSDTRSENETREEYKLRLKQNRQVMKLYNKVGREQFKKMFPKGVNYDMFKQLTKEEVNEKQNKTTSQMA